LGIGDWGLGPIPNPQSPMINIIMNKILLYINKYFILLLLLLFENFV